MSGIARGDQSAISVGEGAHDTWDHYFASQSVSESRFPDNSPETNQCRFPDNSPEEVQGTLNFWSEENCTACDSAGELLSGPKRQRLEHDHDSTRDLGHCISQACGTGSSHPAASSSGESTAECIQGARAADRFKGNWFANHGGSLQLLNLLNQHRLESDWSSERLDRAFKKTQGPTSSVRFAPTSEAHRMDGASEEKGTASSEEGEEFFQTSEGAASGPTPPPDIDPVPSPGVVDLLKPGRAASVWGGGLGNLSGRSTRSVLPSCPSAVPRPMPPPDVGQTPATQWDHLSPLSPDDNAGNEEGPMSVRPRDRSPSPSLSTEEGSYDSDVKKPRADLVCLL
jgi:hypothetical protein